MPYHEFMVGKIRCVVVPNGEEVITNEELIGLFPEGSVGLQEAVATTLTEPQRFSMNCLLIDVAGQLILLDTGLGTMNPDYTSQLLPNLAEIGVTPEQIHMVIISHGHSDHFGGLLDQDGNPNFPNAQHFISSVDWNYWAGGGINPRVEQYLLPLKEKFTLIDMDVTIVPGVRAISAPGHTPGHLGILVESEGEKFLHMVDAAHHPIQMLNPAWSPKFDIDAVLSAQTRRNLFQEAVNGNYRVMAYHFGFPGLGTVEAEGDAFRFKPLTL